MLITKYLDFLDVTGKSYSLLAIAPKGKYPLRSYGNEFNNFAKEVLSKENKYIGIFENNRPEILQDVAFRLFTIPLVGDEYSMVNQETLKNKRATKEQLEAFYVSKEFYDTVPSGQKTEAEAIESGIERARPYIDKYLDGNYDVVITNVNRHDQGVIYLHDMEFDRTNTEYVFDYCYCN
ncbi:hypothetical protein MKX64_15450 [Paenibacillus sp. FSL M8-0334]|uniref:hypothetical protein n=1 Tax=Paenibacillus sp. FSL M8-0334 TaxID=2921623 RepID=UPI0030F80EB1